MLFHPDKAAVCSLEDSSHQNPAVPGAPVLDF